MMSRTAICHVSDSSAGFFCFQVIVTTPEKWDVVTRKGGDGSLVSSVGLIMIDEVS